MDYIKKTQYQNSEIRNPKSEIKIPLFFLFQKKINQRKEESNTPIHQAKTCRKNLKFRSTLSFQRHQR